MRQIFSGGGRRERQEKVRKRHRDRGRRRPGGRRQELRKNTRKRRELQKKGPGQRKETQKQRRRGGRNITVTIQEGAHD